MAAPTPPWLVRRDPVRALLTARAAYETLNNTKTVTVGNEAGLVFGDIAIATAVRPGFQYTSTEGEDFVIGAGIGYTGDAGAFTITGDEFTMTYASPIALVDGLLIFWPVPPDTNSETYDLIITALAANAGVPKTGTLTVYDRFAFSGGATPVRVLKTLTLSKTYVP